MTELGLGDPVIFVFSDNFSKQIPTNSVELRKYYGCRHKCSAQVFSNVDGLILSFPDYFRYFRGQPLQWGKVND